MHLQCSFGGKALSEKSSNQFRELSFYMARVRSEPVNPWTDNFKKYEFITVFILWESRNQGYLQVTVHLHDHIWLRTQNQNFGECWAFIRA